MTSSTPSLDEDPLACVAAGDSRLRRGGSLKFFFGPMDCGKSTLALQMDYNHGRQGRRGLVLTKHDRAGGPAGHRGSGSARRPSRSPPTSTSRPGPARAHDRVDYLICDEASFYTVAQIEQLADLVDDLRRRRLRVRAGHRLPHQLFPAAQRLFELADEVCRVQVEVLCWCGRPGLLNARVVSGRHGP